MSHVKLCQTSPTSSSSCCQISCIVPLWLLPWYLLGPCIQWLVHLGISVLLWECVQNGVMLPLPALRSLTLALWGKLDEDEASWLKFTIFWNWLQLGVVVAPLLVAPLVLVATGDQFLSTCHVGRFVVREWERVIWEWERVIWEWERVIWKWEPRRWAK
jgi:hypothetical protein